MKYFLSLIVLLACVQGFGVYGRKAAPVPFSIRGEIRGLMHDSIFVYLSRYNADGTRMSADTFAAAANSGRFAIEGIAPTTGNAWATIGGMRSNRSFSFFIEKGTIHIRGSIDSLDDLEITGTPGNDDQTRSRKVTQAIYRRIKPMRLQLKDLPPDGDEYKALSAAINTRFDSIQNYELAFIRSYPRSLLSGTYLYVKQDKLPLNELEQLFNALSPEVQGSGFGVIVREKIKARKVVALGNIAPDFTSKDTSGNEVRLSDFRGRYVLLEFWANWCVPCRAQSPHLARMYNKFKDRGFTILQYSIDEKSAERKWKDAIVKDKLTWPQIADLEGFDSKVSKLYGVQPIPDNFLIDREGKIVGRRLEGRHLEEALEKITD